MKRQQWLIKYLMSSPHTGVLGCFVHGLPLKEGTNSSQSLSIIGSIFFLEEIVIFLGLLGPCLDLPTMFHRYSLTVLAISEEPGLGDRGIVGLAATNNWSEESYHCIWLFIIRDHEHWPCWQKPWPSWGAGATVGSGCAGLTRDMAYREINCLQRSSKKHKLFLSLLSSSFPLLSLPTCWGLLILLQYQETHWCVSSAKCGTLLCKCWVGVCSLNLLSGRPIAQVTLDSMAQYKCFWVPWQDKSGCAELWFLSIYSGKTSAFQWCFMFFYFF